MTIEQQTIPSQNDKIMAALAHISAILPFMGVIAPIIIFGAIFIGGALFILYGLIGAIQVFQGKDFRYAIIGNRLATYLQKNN